MIQKTVLFVFILLAGISSVLADNNINITEKTIKFGRRTHDNRPIEAVIIHTTYNASGGKHYDLHAILHQFSRYHVGAHYLIARDGQVYQLVSEKDIAFHAGKSKLPDGKGHVNLRSIGIEIMNNKLDTPTREQIIAATSLVKQIQKRLPIKYVLRHSDIAPGRKTDPWNLNWNEFNEMIHPYNLGQK